MTQHYVRYCTSSHSEPVWCSDTIGEEVGEGRRGAVCGIFQKTIFKTKVWIHKDATDLISVCKSNA